MAITDPEHLSTLARMLGVTVNKCRSALAAATRRTDDVASQIRHVALLCVEDPERRDQVLLTLGVPPKEIPPEEPAEIMRETPPPMPRRLLQDVPEDDLEQCLADREEWFNMDIARLRREANTRGFVEVEGLTKIQLVDLLAWVDNCDIKRVAKQMEGQ